MSYRSLRSTTLKTSFAQLDDFLLNHSLPDLGEDLLLHEVEKQYNWLQCFNVDTSNDASISKTHNHPEKQQRQKNSEKQDIKAATSSLTDAEDEEDEEEEEDDDADNYGEEEGLEQEEQQEEEEEDDDEDEKVKVKASNIEVEESSRKKRSNNPTREELLLELNSLYEPSDDEKSISFDKTGENDSDDDFYTGVDISALIHKDTNFAKKKPTTSKYIEEKTFKGIEMDLFKKQRKKKVWCLSGLYAKDAGLDNNKQEDDEEEGKKPDNFEFIFPENKTFFSVETDYKLPFNVFCPNMLDDSADKSVFDTFTQTNVNNHQDKLISLNKTYTVNGDEISEDAETDRKYQEYKNSNNIYDHSGVEVFDTDIKGYGLRAVREYQPDELVMEYTGDILSYQEFNQLQTTKDYCLHFVDGFVLDSFKNGSLARFINHSIKPNCYFKVFLANDKGELKPKVGIFACSETISSADELTLDYNTNRVHYIKPQRCYCGEPQCNGFIREFYNKLNLINFLSFNIFYSSNSDLFNAGDMTNIRHLIKAGSATNYSQKKLKKLSIFCSIPTDEDRHESYFYVVGSNEAYFIRKAEELKKAEEREKRLESNYTGDIDLDSDFDEIRAKKLKRKTPFGRKSLSAEKIKRPSSTNGSAEFNALPPKLQKQLGIDMVMADL
ncbi:hypothetical protein DASC09_036110 [Saccharomycopsis crataegensis]|uniref:SET domain-containing protein n=1 Tax=Saccharomycopsis crataegensis TaxID=43959 RepID=A0AAV5QNZ0_9ASCO|nr:hypothetical protein DASC09_036110 [Saccharomycopsis crataegensis]